MRLWVIGGGLAGLTAAWTAMSAGIDVRLFEAGRPGGRCRTVFDRRLGARLDLGPHLLIGAYRRTLALLEALGAADGLVPATDPPGFPGLDLEDGQRWCLRPNRGPVPWWLLVPDRRIAGGGLAAHVDAWRLMEPPALFHRAGIGPNTLDANKGTVADRLSETALYRRLWQPLTRAVFNTEPEAVPAGTLWRVLGLAFAAGSDSARPLVPRVDLEAALITPLVQALGPRLHPGQRLLALSRHGRRVTGLRFRHHRIDIGGEDAVLLALPRQAVHRLAPDLPVGPAESRAIVTLHVRTPEAHHVPAFCGLVGGTADWVFRRDDILSVTTGTADALLSHSADRLAATLWRDLAAGFGVPPHLPPDPAAWRLYRVRDATPRQTAVWERRRPAARTACDNLFLAGDWTATDLPATIESAVRSGEAAVAALSPP